MQQGYQASYVDWYVGNQSKAGDIPAYLIGYSFYMPDVKIFTDR